MTQPNPIESEGAEPKLFGMKIKTDPKVPENALRFDHPDGRSEGFILPKSELPDLDELELDNVLVDFRRGNLSKKETRQLIQSLLNKARLEELKRLKEEYHNNIVSDDRMDLEIDERIAELEARLKSKGEQ
jgi:hypothetical protein